MRCNIALLIARCRLFCAVHIAGYNVHIVECSAHIVKCSVHIFRASASRARLRIFIAGQRVSRLRIPSIQVSQVSSPGNCCLINKQVDPIQSHSKESASSASQVSSTGNAELLLYDSTGVFSGSLWDPIIINKLSLNLWQNQKVSKWQCHY